MNAKTCKRLRKMAHTMHNELLARKLDAPVRKLMVHPAHERKAKDQGHMTGVTAVNHKQSWRGIYRWLKRNYHAA